MKYGQGGVRMTSAPSPLHAHRSTPLPRRRLPSCLTRHSKGIRPPRPLLQALYSPSGSYSGAAVPVSAHRSCHLSVLTRGDHFERRQ